MWGGLYKCVQPHSRTQDQSWVQSKIYIVNPLSHNLKTFHCRIPKEVYIKFFLIGNCQITSSNLLGGYLTDWPIFFQLANLQVFPFYLYKTRFSLLNHIREKLALTNYLVGPGLVSLINTRYLLSFPIFFSCFLFRLRDFFPSHIFKTLGFLLPIPF